MKELVIDTDIGTDPDDAFAIAYAVRSGAKIKALTIVQGDTNLRARIARKLTDLLEAEIPITIGFEGPNPEKYWGRFEKLALTEKEACQKIKAAKFPKYSENTKLACIAPLTNIAWQLCNNKTIKNVKEAYFMGSHEGSHNFKVDPEAAETALAQPWKKYFITKEDSKKITLDEKELKKIRGTKLGDFLYDSALRGMKHMKRNNACMYDVLAISAAMGEDFVKFGAEGDKYISYDVDLKLKEKIMEMMTK